MRGDTATTMLNRAEKRYQKALERMRVTRSSGALARESGALARESLRRWRDLWLDQLRHERDQLLMGRHPRQTEFYRDGKGA